MGDFPHSFDIILFALVAVFLVLRLRSVLGRRTGNGRRREPLIRQAEPSGDKVVAFGQRGQTAPPPPASAPPADSVAAGLAQIRGADPNFDPSAFLQGARAAFEMIVGAFAAGEKAQLRPLLADEVYTPFLTAIDERSARTRAAHGRGEKLGLLAQLVRRGASCCRAPRSAGDRQRDFRQSHFRA